MAASRILGVWNTVSLAVHASSDEVRGNVVLQNLIYFITKRAETASIPYAAHFFGPYSSNLSIAVGHLVDADRLDCKILPAGRLKVYRYATAGSYKGDLEDLKSLHRKEFEAMSEIAGICNGIPAQERQGRMACAAKVRYVSEKEADLGADAPSLSNMCARYGWNVSEGEADQGKALLDEMGIGIRS